MTVDFEPLFQAMADRIRVEPYPRPSRSKKTQYIISARTRERLQYLSEWRMTAQCAEEWSICIEAAWNWLSSRQGIESRLVKIRSGGPAREWRQRA